MKTTISLAFALVILVVVAYAGYTYMNKGSGLFTKRSHTAIIAQLKQTREIDRLYTGVYLIPALDKSWGMLKSDIAKDAAEVYINPLKTWEFLKESWEKKTIDRSDKIRKVVKGYCLKRYEVSVGYDHLADLLADEKLVQEMCSKGKNNLPPPSILAVNSRSTEQNGKYEGQCESWDGDPQKRNAIILEEMQQTHMLERVSERGKEALGNMLNLFCK